MTFGSQPTDMKFLDGEECLRLWLLLGSLAKVQSRLSIDGVVSNRTGKSPSRTGIQHSAQRWILRNPQEAWDKYLNDFYMSSGHPRTFEDWKRSELETMASNNLTPKGFQKFSDKWLK